MDKELQVSRRTLLAAAAAAMVGSAVRPGFGQEHSKLVAYDTPYLGFYGFVVMHEAIKRKVESYGLQFISKNANGDSNVQVANWNSFLLQKPRYLISDAIDSELLVPVASKAAAQGTAVGMVDNYLTGGKIPASVTFDNKLAGVMAAEKTAELLTKKYGQPKGTVINNYGSVTAVVLRNRKDGFEETMKAKYHGIEVISRPQNNQHEEALSVVSATLRERPDLDAIHMPTDIFTADAVKALKNQGRLFPVGDKNHVIVVSIDGTPNGLGWLKDGMIDANIALDVIAWGECIVELLETYTAKGLPIPIGPYENKNYAWERADIVEGPSGPLMVQPPYFLTPENLDDPRNWGNIATKKWGMPQDAP